MPAVRYVSPRKIVNVASVVISVLMPTRVMIRPFTSPAAAPTASPTAKPSGAGHPHQPTVTPAQTPLSARIEPIDRSNAPAIISTIMPVTRIAFCDAFSSTAAMLNRVGKLFGYATVIAVQSATTSTSSMSGRDRAKLRSTRTPSGAAGGRTEATPALSNSALMPLPATRRGG